MLLQLIGYLIEIIPRIAPNTLALAVPIALGALCGVLCERSGVVNIGIEGMMLMGAFVGWVTGAIVVQYLPTDKTAIFGITLPLLVAVGAAMLSGMILALVHAWLSISVRADQIISGTIINIAALSLTGYLGNLLDPTLQGAGRLRAYRPPEALVDIPGIGWIFDMFLNQGPIAMSCVVLVILLQILLFRSRWGLRTRAVGEHPKAADTVGIDVIRVRYRNVILGGALAGLAGGYLTLELTGSFQDNMTLGRGFIALAAVIFGRWTPVGAFIGALLFAASEAIGIQIGVRPPHGELGDLLGQIPNNFYRALPYVITIIILAGVVGRSVAPAAVGQPYQKEARS
jgi:simple sugar transport system permease protein